MYLVKKVSLRTDELDLILESLEGYKLSLESGFGFAGLKEKIKKIDQMINDIETGNTGEEDEDYDEHDNEGRGF